ncbi:MAG: hypothetical protein ABSH47_05455 [Bryobacteraceae bacterium]
MKAPGVWAMFRDEDLPARPSRSDARGRSVFAARVAETAPG